MSTERYIEKYLEETAQISRNINQEDIQDFINILYNTWKRGKKVVTMGNGGSASTASHFAGDLAKTVANDSSMKEISETKGFKAMCLNDNSPSLTAWINDSGWDKAYTGLLNTFLEEGDTILLVSVHGGSGWSGNLVGAMQLAKKRGAKILGLAGFDGGKMKEMADACVVVPKDSTPHTEGFHCVIQHLIVDRLREMIQEESRNSSKISLFADTANINEIDYCFGVGVNDGITTNPKIIESTGDLSEGFENACNRILSRYSEVPVSLETDLRGMEISEVEANPERVRDILIEQAESLSSMGKNLIVKIPICEGGLLATKELSKRGVRTNVTACMSPYQALEAAKSGATYVSLFANRMLDAKILSLAGYQLDIIKRTTVWKDIVKDNKEKYFNLAWDLVLKEIAYVARELEKTDTKLIVGSIRSPEDIHKIVKAGPQVITIPTKIVKELRNIDELKELKRAIDDFSRIELGNSLSHPMTHITLEEFEKSAEAYRNTDIKITLN